MTITERRILDGFAIAYRFTDQGFDEEGKRVYLAGAILLGPRVLQADELPIELADAIEAFLIEHIETIDE